MAPHHKPAPIPLSAFHQQVSGEVVPSDERLPSGPGETSSGAGNKVVGTRRWIAEWDGKSEHLETSALPAGGSDRDSSMTIDAFKSALDLCLREFLSNGDIVEAARCIEELNLPELHFQVVKRGVTLAMDKAGREREMVAVLLASLYARGLLTSAHVSDGFVALLESLPDLVLDIPSAPGLLTHFLADAHLDGLLPLASLDAIEAACTEHELATGVLRDARARLVGRIPLGGSQTDKGTVRAELRSVVTEYLSSHDTAEVRRRLAELCVPADLRHQLVRAAIELGLERRDHDRELVSQLLSSLHGSELSAEETSRGFEMLLSRLDDLSIDNPHASEHLAAFMTRAVADEILPPAFVATPPPERLAPRLMLETLHKARATLSASHFGDRRRHVWGAAADGSLDDLKKAVRELCDEYFVSGVVDEAVRCVRELEAPSYHHEVVKRLVGASVVDGGPRELGLAVDFTCKLAQAELLPSDQLAQGCTRLLEALPDLRLDHPHAATLLADYLERMCEARHLEPTATWQAAAQRLREEECARTK